MKWRYVKGFEGLYMVSDTGKVKSLGNGNSTNPQFSTHRILKTRYSTNGYEKVKLNKDGIRTHTHVHRLVASAFIDNPEQKPEVNHKDGDKLNNNASNLEWVTPSENQKHAFNLGMQVARSGADSPCSKQIEQLTINGESVRVWGSINEACNELGYNSMGIIGCCKGRKRYKTAYGYNWRYV